MKDKLGSIVRMLGHCYIADDNWLQCGSRWLWGRLSQVDRVPRKCLLPLEPFFGHSFMQPSFTECLLGAKMVLDIIQAREGSMLICLGEKKREKEGEKSLLFVYYFTLCRSGSLGKRSCVSELHSQSIH